MGLLRWLVVLAVPVWAQLPTCTVPTWSACDLAFDLEAGENSAAVQLHGEFRSAKRTLLIRAFREADRKYILRFAPTEPGEWAYRLTSSIKRLDGQLGKATAVASDSPGFIKVANVHHFANEGTNKQHLWMATAIDNFTKIPRADFDAAVTQRLVEKFSHLRVTIAKDADLSEAADRIPPRLIEHARERDADEREAQPDERADVFQHYDCELRNLGATDELKNRTAGPFVPALVQRSEQRERLEHDRDEQHDDGDARIFELVRMDQLLDALEDREQTADAEQHERDDERPEVPQRPVAERVHLVGRTLRSGAAEHQQPLVASVGE